MESSGYIILTGKEEEDDSVSLHIYKYKDEWQKIGTKPGPCSHSELCTYPLVIENNERLLVSCWQCTMIWFCDINTGNFSQALKEELFCPALMCKAEGDCVFIENYVQGLKSIPMAKCTPSEIIVDKAESIYSVLDKIYSICYLPSVKCVAASSWQDHVVKAIHRETDEMVWEMKGEVAGVTWQPHGLFYSPKHQSLLVCDTINSRLVVLNPCDGSVLQVIPLPGLELPYQLCLYEGNIIVHNGFSRRTQINVFNMK